VVCLPQSIAANWQDTAQHQRKFVSSWNRLPVKCRFFIVDNFYNTIA